MNTAVCVLIRFSSKEEAEGSNVLLLGFAVLNSQINEPRCSSGSIGGCADSVTLESCFLSSFGVTFASFVSFFPSLFDEVKTA